MNKVITFKHRNGTKAYAIRDGRTHLYFIWCYSSEQFANVIANTVRIEDAADQQANWRASISQLVLSDQTSLDDRSPA